MLVLGRIPGHPICAIRLFDLYFAQIYLREVVEAARVDAHHSPCIIEKQCTAVGAEVPGDRHGVPSVFAQSVDRAFRPAEWLT